jgi:hypothetical protein
MMSVEASSLFPERFGFDAQQVGLQSISIIIGSLIDKQVGGFLNDWWMWRRHRGVGSGGSDNENQEGEDVPVPRPEFRLWLSYPGCLGTRHLRRRRIPRPGRPCWQHMERHIPRGQVVTTVATTYAIDCYREDTAGVGVLINFIR